MDEVHGKGKWEEPAGQLPFLITEVVAVPDEGKNALGVAKRKDDTKLVQLL